MKKIFSFVILFFCIFSYGAVTVTVNGSNYSIPQTNERGWGTAVTNWIQAISSNTLQPVGGSFTLTNDVDFGASYGLKSSYILSRNSNPATAGLLRLNVTDYIGWRNNANSGNLLLAVNASDKLTFNGSVVATVPLARSDLGSGTANHVIINDGSGVLSSEAQLAKSRGGTGADNSSVTFPSSGTIATQAGVEVLTNKDIDGGTASNTSRITVPKDTLTNLQSLTRKQGTLVFDTTSNKPYYDDGSNLKVIGSGSGGASNLIDDGDAEAGTSNYVEGSYSAATRPSGTFTPSSGAGAFAISTTTSSPLFGNTSFLLTKSSGASRQGRAVERTITIPSGYRTKMLKTRIDYTIVSGSFVAGSNGSSPTDSSLIWYVGQYNGSTWTYHEPSTFKMFSSSTTNPDYVEGEFQVNSDTTQIKLIAYVAETANSAWVVKCEVGIKESTIAAGTTVTNDISFTPTLTNAGNATAVGAYRQVGSKAEIIYTVTIGSTLPTGTIAVSKPSNLSLGYSANTTIPDATAKGVAGATGTTFVASVRWDNANQRFDFLGGNGQQFWNATVPFTWTNGDVITFAVTVPITGWSSSTQVSDGYDGRQIGAKVQRITTDQSIANATETKVQFNSIVDDKTGSFDAVTNYRYTAPSFGDYEFDGQLTMQGTAGTGSAYVVLYKNGAGLAYQHNGKNGTGTNLWSLPFKFKAENVKASDYFEIYVYQATGGSLNLISNSSVGQASVLNIKKLQSPQTMSATEVVAARYTGTISTSLASGSDTRINFNNKVIDTHGAVTTGASWVFSPNTAGIYSVKVGLTPASGSTTTWEMKGWKNGTQYNTFSYVSAGLAGGQFFSGADSVQLNAGDTFYITMYQGSGGSIGTDTTGNRVYIDIERIK